MQAMFLKCLKPVLFGLGLLGFSQAQVHAIPTIYTIGDSTVATYSSGYYPKTGWGQVLPKFLDSAKVAVSNKAVSGTSSKSFYNNYWSGVKNSLKSGDYVFIQFGINDSASDDARHTDASTTFKDYLTKFCNEAEARGAYPVLVATLRRNSWNSDGTTVYNAYHGYPVATRELASSLGVPLIDLDSRCKTLMESVGKTYCTYFIYMHLEAGEWSNYSSGASDDVHFQESGALEMAKLVHAGIKASGDANVKKLVSALRPWYTVTFTKNNSSGGTITRTQSYPQGVTVTAKARPNSGWDFTKWSNGLSSTKKTTTFVMGSAAKTVTANFAQ